MCTRRLAKMARDEKCSLHGARVTLCTSRGKLATQMGPKNQTLPQPGKPFFDYGCQYFTVSSSAWFTEEVQKWAKLGLCQPLPQGQVGTLSSSEGFATLPGDRWVGNGGMGPMLTNMIQQTAQEFEDTVELVSGFPNEANKVVGLRKLASPPCHWELKTKDGKTLGPFTYVVGGFAQHVLTDPFLLSGGAACSSMLECLRRVESNQIIPIQVIFEGEPLPIPFTAAHVYGDEVLSFIGNNTKKPQQNGKWGTAGPQHLTLLSTAEFAEREFNCNPKGYRRIAEEKLLASLGRLLGVDVWKHKPYINRINHWEDGLPVKTPPDSRSCLFDAAQGLGWCGDFCVSPGVEGAANSGIAMADVLDASLKVHFNLLRFFLLPLALTRNPSMDRRTLTKLVSYRWMLTGCQLSHFKVPALWTLDLLLGLQLTQHTRTWFLPRLAATTRLGPGGTEEIPRVRLTLPVRPLPTSGQVAMPEASTVRASRKAKGRVAKAGGDAFTIHKGTLHHAR